MTQRRGERKSTACVFAASQISSIPLRKWLEPRSNPGLRVHCENVSSFEATQCALVSILRNNVRVLPVSMYERGNRRWKDLHAVIVAGVARVAVVGNYTCFGSTYAALTGPRILVGLPVCGRLCCSQWRPVVPASPAALVIESEATGNVRDPTWPRCQRIGAPLEPVSSTGI